MLRIAVQSKGRLFEDTMQLLSEADIKVSASKRTLLVDGTVVDRDLCGNAVIQTVQQPSVRLVHLFLFAQPGDHIVDICKAEAFGVFVPHQKNAIFQYPFYRDQILYLARHPICFLILTEQCSKCF